MHTAPSDAAFQSVGLAGNLLLEVQAFQTKDCVVALEKSPSTAEQSGVWDTCGTLVAPREHRDPV